MFKPTLKIELGDITAEVPLELTREYNQEELYFMALQKLKVRAVNTFDIAESKKKNKVEHYGAIIR